DIHAANPHKSCEGWNLGRLGAQTIQRGPLSAYQSNRKPKQNACRLNISLQFPSQTKDLPNIEPVQPRPFRPRTRTANKAQPFRAINKNYALAFIICVYWAYV